MKARSVILSGLALVGASSVCIAQVPAPGPAVPGPGPSGPGLGMPGPRPQMPGSEGPLTRPPSDSPLPGMKESDVDRAPKGAESAPETLPKGKARPKATEAPEEKTRLKASEGPQRQAPQATETQPQKSQPKATQTRPEKSEPKASESQRERGQQSTERAREGEQTSRVQVSEEQRSGVRDRLFREGNFEKTKLDIRVNVGTRLPRSVHLLTLPAAIVEFAPSYRDYSYVVLEDETICVVDPKTYEVVDVIGERTQRTARPQRAGLALTDDQMRLIYASVPKEPQADVRVRLALGAEIPADVELFDFPQGVIAQVPEIEGYGYIVVQNDVIVVEPAARQIALVVTE
jgi:hypothetical protein